MNLYRLFEISEIFVLSMVLLYSTQQIVPGIARGAKGAMAPKF